MTGHVHHRRGADEDARRTARANLAKAEAAIADGREAGGAGRLPAGAVHRPLLLPEGRRGPVRPRRADPRAQRRTGSRPRRRRTSVVVVGSLFEKRMAGVYHNTATVHDADGDLLGLYRKMHIPDDPLFLEKFYFTPGDLGFKVFTTPAGEGRHARLLGPVVSRRRPGSRRCRGRR